MSISVSQNSTKETLTPDPDGVTVVFYTSQAYKNGSITVWRNGLKLIKDWDSGFTLTGTDNITMNEAPLSGDSLHVEYDAV